MTSVGGRERRHVIITDLDEMTPPATNPEENKKTLYTRQNKELNIIQGHSGKILRRPTMTKQQGEKVINTVSGNFSRRSRSAECHFRQETIKPSEDVPCRTDKSQGAFNEQLRLKERQMERLLERISTLHRFNDQFAEENQRLRLNVDELERRLTDCQRCRTITEELNETAAKCRTQEAELEMAKTLIYRLNVQIERYQDNIRRLKIGENTGPDMLEECESAAGLGKSSSSQNISQWDNADSGLHRSSLAPLLLAYDEMLRDKDYLIRQYGKKFERFTGELKHILEENGRLQHEQETQRREVSTWREHRARLQAQLDVCRKKAEEHTRKGDLAKEKLVEIMEFYEQRTQTLVLDLEHLQSAYTRCKAECAALRSNNTTSQRQEMAVGSLQESHRQQQDREKHELERSLSEVAVREASGNQRIEQLKNENVTLIKDLERQRRNEVELKQRAASLQRSIEKVKRSRDRLKARLRIALQWAQKLEEGQDNVQNTWDALKRLETVVRHKESQVRGLHARHLEEIGHLQQKLAQKEETIRSILKSKLNSATNSVWMGDGDGDVLPKP